MATVLNIRVSDDDEPRLREIARQMGALAPSGAIQGQPSISRLLMMIASGALVVTRREEMEIEVLFSEFEAELPDQSATGCISYPATISTRHAASSYGQPVVIIDGEARGVAEMPPGELGVPKEYLALVRAAGYEAQELSDEDRERYWEDAPPVEDHWHPEARLIRY